MFKVLTKRCGILIVTLLMGLFYSTYLVASPINTKVLNVHHWITPRGTNVYFVKKKKNNELYIKLLFRNTGFGQNQQLTGLANLTFGLLTKGTDRLTDRAFMGKLTSFGGDLSSVIGLRDGSITLFMPSPKQHLKAGLSLLSSMIAHPRIHEKEFLSEKARFLSGVKPDQHASLKPEVSNWIKHVKPLTLHDVKRFYHDYYAAQNTNIIIVGNVSIDQAKTIAHSLSSSLPAKKQKQHKKASMLYATSSAVILPGNVGLNYRDNMFPYLVVQAMLGNKQFSVLFQDADKRPSFPDPAVPYLSYWIYNTHLYIWFKAYSQRANSASSIVRQKIASLINTGISESQLAQAKESAIKQALDQLKNNYDIVSEVTIMIQRNYPANFFNHFQANVDSVTHQQVMSVLKHLKSPSRPLILIVSKKV